MVDMDVINRILVSLSENIDHMEKKRKISFEQYARDRDMQAIIERKLETSIQACIDIGNHIISHDHLGIPNNYGDIFTILEQKDIISKDIADEMIKATGLRNLLIHEYRELVLEKVYDVLQNKLDIFRLFAKQIADKTFP